MEAVNKSCCRKDLEQWCDVTAEGLGFTVRFNATVFCPDYRTSFSSFFLYFYSCHFMVYSLHSDPLKPKADHGTPLLKISERFPSNLKSMPYMGPYTTMAVALAPLQPPRLRLPRPHTHAPQAGFHLRPPHFAPSSAWYILPQDTHGAM